LNSIQQCSRIMGKSTQIWIWVSEDGINTIKHSLSDTPRFVPHPLSKEFAKKPLGPGVSTTVHLTLVTIKTMFLRNQQNKNKLFQNLSESCSQLHRNRHLIISHSWVVKISLLPLHAPKLRNKSLQKKNWKKNISLLKGKENNNLSLRQVSRQ